MSSLLPSKEKMFEMILTGKFSRLLKGVLILLDELELDWDLNVESVDMAKVLNIVVLSKLVLLILMIVLILFIFKNKNIFIVCKLLNKYKEKSIIINININKVYFCFLEWVIY